MMAGALKELKRGDLGHWVAKRAGEACRAVKFMDVTSRLKRGSRAEKNRLLLAVSCRCNHASPTSAQAGIRRQYRCCRKL